MREIKFRAWNKWMKRMEPTREFDAKDYPVMQFTGLLDKNGREIYEGDIVRDIYGQINSITFCGGSFWFNWLEMPHYLDQVECGEVIGNIYEHPHLLEAK